MSLEETHDTISFEEVQRQKRLDDSGLDTLTLEELVTMKIPPRVWILRPLLQHKGSVMIYGYRGVGKTFVSTGVAYAIATGSDFLNWKGGAPKKVLFVDGEMPEEALQERFVQLITSFDKEPFSKDHLRILAADHQELGIPDLSTEKGRKAIEPHLEGIDVVILDNVSTLCRSGRENDAESWTPIQEWLLDLRRRGISTILIHHASKDGNQRGTSRREDILDTVVVLKRPPDYTPEEGARFEVHYEKTRGAYGEAVAPFEAKLETENGKIVWTVNPLEDIELQTVADLVNEGLSIRDIEAELGMKKSKVGRLRKRAQAEGLLNK